MVYHTDLFAHTEIPCIPGVNPIWSWYVILLTYCWIWFANILLRIFASMLSVILAQNFLFLWYFCLVLVSGWCWLCRKSSKVFLPLQFFRKSLRRTDVNSSLTVLQNRPVCMFFNLSAIWVLTSFWTHRSVSFIYFGNFFHQFFKYCLHSAFPLSVWVSKTHAQLPSRCLMDFISRADVFVSWLKAWNIHQVLPPPVPDPLLSAVCFLQSLRNFLAS